MNASVMEDKPTIYIKTLGGFSLRVGDKEITDNSNQSKKPWCLLDIWWYSKRNPSAPVNLSTSYGLTTPASTRAVPLKP